MAGPLCSFFSRLLPGTRALSQVKAANDSCSTFFYLNSQIDFAGLQLHDQFVAANGSWWLRNDAGGFVLHGSDHIFDVTVAAARSACSNGGAAVAQPHRCGPAPHTPACIHSGPKSTERLPIKRAGGPEAGECGQAVGACLHKQQSRGS